MGLKKSHALQLIAPSHPFAFCHPLQRLVAAFSSLQGGSFQEEQADKVCT
jgi:hypothetical protein